MLRVVGEFNHPISAVGNPALDGFVLHLASGGCAEGLAVGLWWSLLHPLSRLGQGAILGSDCPKDGSGCAVDNLQTLTQQTRIPVIELAVRKFGLVFQSKCFTDHEGGGFGFLLVQSSGYKGAAPLVNNIWLAISRSRAVNSSADSMFGSRRITPR